MTARPDPDLVYGLFWGALKPQCARLALELGVFAALADGPRSAAEVGAAGGADPAGVALLLDYLVSLKILEGRDSLYALTPTAAHFLLPGRPAFGGDLVLDYAGPEFYPRLRAAVLSGQPAVLKGDFVQDAWLESYSPRRPASALDLWRTVGVLPAPPRPVRVLDVACGCAIKTLTLAQAAPQVRVTGVDTPAVLAVAHDLARRLNVQDRVDFRAGDLHQFDFGQAACDVVLLGQITHYLCPDQNRALLARLARALSAEGVLVIDCPMPPEAGQTEATSLLSLFTWAEAGGRVHAFAQYQAWLAEAGFTRIVRHTERWLSAHRRAP